MVPFEAPRLIPRLALTVKLAVVASVPPLTISEPGANSWIATSSSRSIVRHSTPLLARSAPVYRSRTRVGIPTERGLRAQVAGAGWASASRTVAGTPASALEALNATLTREESLAIKRRYAERWTWEPRRDFWAMFRRIGGWRFDLQHASEIAATVIPVDEQRVTVRLDADVSRTRNERLEQGAGVAVGGVVSGGVVAGLASIAHFAVIAIFPIAAVPVVAGLAGGYALARRHRETMERTQLALEQVLDRLEHGDIRR